MMKAVLLAAFAVVPAAAKAADTGLPIEIRAALNDAASTGNPLVVSAVADRMTSLFPTYGGEIDAYLDMVATPATHVMAAVNDMWASLPVQKDQGFAMLFDAHEAQDEGDSASLAQDLNDIEVGAGGEQISVLR